VVGNLLVLKGLPRADKRPDRIEMLWDTDCQIDLRVGRLLSTTWTVRTRNLEREVWEEQENLGFLQ
jgi:hypothetical protein